MIISKKIICALYYLSHESANAFSLRSGRSHHDIHDVVTSRTTKFPSLESDRRRRDIRNTILFARKDEEGERKLWNGIVSLWDEIVEVSTYGPSERKMLKVQRERQKQIEEVNPLQGRGDLDLRQKDYAPKDGSEIDIDDDRAWMEAFAAVQSTTTGVGEEDCSIEYDGYALRDLLIEKWGVPLDLDFQRIGKQLYCTILPVVGHGSPLRSRHNSELDYLMHLQGIIEVLHKYDNLELFIAFVETTKKTPKRGTDSVPFRLKLRDEVIDSIIRE